MKKVLALFSLVTMLALGSFATPKKGTWKGWVSDKKCGATMKAGCTKACADAGQALVFVTDKGHKVLAVSNPEVLKGHEGHHIKVKGTIDNGTLTIASASMLKNQKLPADKDKDNDSGMSNMK